MKRIIIGALVGAIIFFVFQAAMWMGGIHKDVYSYTPNQEQILDNLNRNLSAEGMYMIPALDPASNPTHEQEEAYMAQNVGKPWAMVFYHTSMSGMDPMYLVKGFLYAFIAAFMTAMVLYYGKFDAFSTRWMVAMSFAVFTLCQGVLDEMNWWSYPWSFIRPQVIDMILGWGLTSVWLGKYVK
jgi:hypothetical protein